ncbi:MAG TPA: NAD(P)-dependent oxidoreductase, partial [Puia sp.]|nr:NAD(P)-dependent oxidoreductase [Puia sp.]
MKILITGANGLLGQHLTKLLLDNGDFVIATGKGESRLPFVAHPGLIYKPLDISNIEDAASIFSSHHPDVVIHAAALTQVDYCQLNMDEAYEINVRGTSKMLEYAVSNCRHFIYISTDFVFDGNKGNYKEEDETGPVNYYGKTKLEAEILVKKSSLPWSIVRTCLVYGNTLQGTRSNIIRWVQEKLEKNERIRVVDDQERTPTYVGDLVKGIQLVLQKKAEGIFHISGKEFLTPYDMAVQTAKYLS